MSSERGEKVEMESSKVSMASSKANLAIVLLRLLAFLATLSATLVMALNKETKTITVATIGTVPLTATITAKFQHTRAFVFFVIANANASFHNLLMLAVTFLKPNFNFKRSIVTLAIPVLDMVNVAIISGGAGAAAFMGQLGREGNSHAKWNKICDKIDSFCDRSGGAMIASFVGLMLMVMISTISMTRLRNHA